MINYSYTDTYLSQVLYPNNLKSTYSYGVDEQGDTVLYAQETRGKVKEVYMTSSAALVSNHTFQVLWNQNSMAVGTVKMNDEITYAYFQNPNTANYSYVYTGQGQMKFRHVDRQVRYLDKDFQFNKDENGNIQYALITGVQESTFMKRNYTGPNGIEYPSVVTDKNGDKSNYYYDKLNRLTFKSYSDKTFESWSYNSLNLPTRYRDRLGRVTHKTYDSVGNLLSEEVGLLDSYTGNSKDYNHVYWSSGNLAQIIGVKATQSSKNNNAKKAIDTNTNGQMNMYSVTETEEELQPWWNLELKRSSLVETIKIFNRKEFPERLANFSVSLFDGETLVFQETIAGPIESEGVVEITLPLNTYADSLKIQLNDTNILSLAEVQVFGSDAVVDAQAPVNDLVTSDYAKFEKVYYPETHVNKHLLKYEYDGNGNKTEFVYDVNQRLLKVIEPSDDGSGTIIKQQMTYNSFGQLATVIDAVGRVTSFVYDERERLIKTLYNDGSSELNIYGDTDLTADLIVKKKDRNGNVTKYEFDGAGRVTNKTLAYSKMDVDGNSEVINPSSLQSVTFNSYLSGQNNIFSSTTNGEETTYIRDYRMRIVSKSRFPDTNSVLTSEMAYLENKVFYETDDYGRKTYYSYRNSDSKLMRIVKETKSTLNLTTYSEVNSLGRDLSNNANYLVTDYILDSEGQRIATIDPRGIRHEMDYDSRGRTIFTVNAADTLAQTTQTIYDANSNVISSIDPVGNISIMTYGSRNKLDSRTVGAGSSVEAIENFTYYDDGRNFEHTDFRGNVSTTVWHQCCGRLQTNIDQDGNFQISNNDFYSNVTHTAIVDKTGIIADYHDLPNGETVQEITTQYDARHRPIARTLWLQPLDYVDPNNVPIATDATHGLTTYYMYYDETSDHAELAPLVAELLADGIDLNGEGAARIVVNPEGEVQVYIQDGVGRTVAQGAMDKEDFANGAYTLVSWSTVINDTITTGGLLETQQVSALGFVSKTRTDGTGRTLEVEDAAGYISTREYDANSNIVKSRDANGVGQDCTFDDLNRDVSCTDTTGSTVTKVFDLNNRLVSSTDAKGQVTSHTYDSRNRKESTTDRLGGVTNFVYDANSNLVSITDALNKVTNYEYDMRNLQTKVTYADTKFTTCDYDALGRKSLCTDQLNEKVEYTYDLAGRMTQRLYKLSDDSVESTDTFTYDLASRPLTATKGRYDNTVSYTYDGIGRKSTETLTIGSAGSLPASSFTTTCNYDSDNRETSCTYSNGDVVTKTYTNRNQLDSLSFNAASIADFTYDNGMRESTRTFGNNIVSTKAYNLDNTLLSVTAANKSDLSFSYTYDPNKNVLSETSTGIIMDDYSWNTGFDAADRVTSWNRTAGNISSQSWNLDLIGNWNSVTTNTITENRTHNDVHELIDIDGQTATYDDKGNLLSVSTKTLNWDIDNHLEEVNDLTLGTTTFTYDALGRRVSKNNSMTGEVLFICHGQRVIEEYSNNGTAYELERSYLHGNYIDDIVAHIDAGTNPTVSYYHGDRQYNVRGLTDASGSILELYAYTTYGKRSVIDPVSSNLKPNSLTQYGFTSRYLDTDTGLWYFRARYFSDELGRFISRDPLGYVDGYGLYNGYFAERFMLDPEGTEQLIIKMKTKVSGYHRNAKLKQKGNMAVYAVITLPYEKYCETEEKPKITVGQETVKIASNWHSTLTRGISIPKTKIGFGMSVNVNITRTNTSSSESCPSGYKGAIDIQEITFTGTLDIVFFGSVSGSLPGNKGGSIGAGTIAYVKRKVLGSSTVVIKQKCCCKIKG